MSEQNNAPESIESYSGAYRRRHLKESTGAKTEYNNGQTAGYPKQNEQGAEEASPGRNSSSAKSASIRKPRIQIAYETGCREAEGNEHPRSGVCPEEGRLIAPRRIHPAGYAPPSAKAGPRRAQVEGSQSSGQRHGAPGREATGKFDLAADLRQKSGWRIRERIHCLAIFAIMFFVQQGLCEFVLRVTTSENFFSIGLIHTPLFVAANALLLAGVVSLFPRRGRYILFAAAMIFFPFIYSAQLIYYRFFRTFFVFYSIGHGGQLAQFTKDIILKILRNLPWILLMFVPVITYFAYLRKRLFAPCMAKHVRWRDSLICVALSVAMFFVSIGSMVFNRTYNSPWQNFFYENEIQMGANQFGLLTAMGVDISHLIFPRSAPIDPDLIPDDPIFTAKPVESTSSSGSEPEPSQTDPGSVVERLPNILPVDFDARLGDQKPDDGTPAVLQGKTRTDQIRYLDKVFSRTVPTYTNDHTGRGKGFNLIFVTAESFSPYAMDPELTPTLWKMWHEGVHFTNFYNPVWGVSTLDGEYAGLCGMIPKPGVWTLKEAHKNDLAMAPGNLFRKLGYTTYAWHNHTWSYYSRDLSHPNLGYLYRGLGHGLEVKRTWPESDLEMMEKTVGEFIGKEPFHVYYLTVSGHAAYTRIGNMMASRHYSVYKHLDLPDEAICYKAANYDLELAMANLLQQLREAGIADRTLIVLNPDHYPYGMEKSNLDAMAGMELDKTFGIYKSAAFFYHDGIKPEVVDKYCCSADLLPTAYNYMGVPFDSRMLSGRDIFSDHDALVIFLGRSWITDYGKYDAKTGVFTLHEGKTLEEDENEYVKRINREVKIRFETAKLIVDSDYYRDLLSSDDWKKIAEPYINWMKENPWPPAIIPETDAGT